MIKKAVLFRRFLLFSIVLFFLFGLPAFAQQKASVTLRPIGHGGSVQAEQLASVVEDILSTTFTLMKGYEFKPVPKDSWPGIETAEAAVDRFSVDNLLSGTITETGDSIKVSLSVYNAAEEREMVVVDGEAGGYLGIFDLTDFLVVRLLEGFTEQVVAFGSLAFTTSGENRDYRVTVDGNDMGENITALERIPADNYEVIVEEVDSGFQLYSQMVEVGEDETAGIPVHIPYLYPQEQKYVHERSFTIKNNWFAGLNEAQPILSLIELDVFLDKKQDEKQSRNLRPLVEHYRSLKDARVEAEDYEIAWGNMLSVRRSIADPLGGSEISEEAAAAVQALLPGKAGLVPTGMLAAHESLP
ncbi:MAG: hypothetical protein K9L68_03785 [Spirochaetales bacterium]|nr:hypothetical protein [Spirochaetales bacterium]MCF7937700.1 hypothetical protein [Spirochaetales bacterium]